MSISPTAPGAPVANPGTDGSRSAFTRPTLVIVPGRACVNPAVALRLAADVDAEGLRRAQLGAASPAGEGHERRDRLAALGARGDHDPTAVGALRGDRRSVPGHEPTAPAAAQAEAAAVAELAAAIVRGHPPILAYGGVRPRGQGPARAPGL